MPQCLKVNHAQENGVKLSTSPLQPSMVSKEKVCVVIMAIKVVNCRAFAFEELGNFLESDEEMKERMYPKILVHLEEAKKWGNFFCENIIS